MPATIETGQSGLQEIRRLVSGDRKLDNISQELAWQVLETFPDVALTRSRLWIRSGVKTLDQAVQAEILPNTTLKWTYESSRDVIKPDEITFYNGVPIYWGGYDRQEEQEAAYKREAEKLRAVGRSLLGGGKVDSHEFEFHGHALEILKSDFFSQLKSQDYQINFFELPIDDDKYSMKSGVRLFGSRLEYKLDRTSYVSVIDARKINDWFYEFKEKVKPAIKTQITV